jgi:hypothetical protein
MDATPTTQTPSAASKRARGFRLTGRDLELLEFVAAHRFVLACHAQSWLGCSALVAYRRLHGLLELGLLSYRRVFDSRAGCYQVTTAGLGVIDSELPRPSVDLRTYRHDIGLVWIWLAARNETFGPCAGVLSEREMRAHDQQSEDPLARFGIVLRDWPFAGRRTVHYPDVLVLVPDGSRIAVELELTLKSRGRLAAILGAYAADLRISGVVYFTDRQPVENAVRETGEKLGLDSRLWVEYFELAPERDIEREWQQQRNGEQQ